MYLIAENSRGGKRIGSIRLISTLDKVAVRLEKIRIIYAANRRDNPENSFYTINAFYSLNFSWVRPKIYEIGPDEDRAPKLLRAIPFRITRNHYEMAIAELMEDDNFTSIQEKIKNGADYFI